MLSQSAELSILELKLQFIIAVTKTGKELKDEQTRMLKLDKDEGNVNN